MGIGVGVGVDVVVGAAVAVIVGESTGAGEAVEKEVAEGLGCTVPVGVGVAVDVVAGVDSDVCKSSPPQEDIRSTATKENRMPHATLRASAAKTLNDWSLGNGGHRFRMTGIPPRQAGLHTGTT